MKLAVRSSIDQGGGKRRGFIAAWKENRIPFRSCPGQCYISERVECLLSCPSAWRGTRRDSTPRGTRRSPASAPGAARRRAYVLPPQWPLAWLTSFGRLVILWRYWKIGKPPTEISDCHMFETILGLLIGFSCGYGVRELVSRRRRAAMRRKHQKHLESGSELSNWGTTEQSKDHAPVVNMRSDAYVANITDNGSSQASATESSGSAPAWDRGALCA